MASENLAVLITGSGRDLINEFKKVGDEAEKSGKKTASGWDKAKTGIKLAGAAIAGTAVAIGVASVEMADKYEASHARLETALRNTGTSWEKQKKQIDAVSEASTKFGYTKTDVEGALAQMTTGMGSAQKAIANFQLVEDVAAKTGKPLADAALAVTKASQGQLRPLKQLGIDLPVAAGGALKVKKANDALTVATNKLKLVQAKVHDGLLKGPAAFLALATAQNGVSDAQDKLNTTQQTGTTILDALGKKLGGAASDQANTFAGKTKALKAQIDNVAISIGMALMPYLIKMVDFIQNKVIPFFQKHTGYAKALAIVLGVTLVAAAGLYIGSMVAAAIATAAAMAPILLIIAAVALVVVGLTKMGINWGNVWRGMQKVYDGLHLQGAVDGIRIAVSDIDAAAQALGRNWGSIWSGIQNSTIDALNQIIRVYNDTIGWITGKIGTLSAAAVTAGNAMKAAAPPPNPYKAVAGPSSIYGPPSPGSPGYKGRRVYGPPAPGEKSGLASGGAARPWHVYTVGEHGPETLQMGGSSGFVHANGSGGNTYVTVHVQGIVSGSARQVGQYISDNLIQYERGNGKRWSAQG